MPLLLPRTHVALLLDPLFVLSSSRISLSSFTVGWYNSKVYSQAQLQENLAEYEAKMNKFKMSNEEKKIKDKEFWDAWFTVYKVR